MKNLKKVLALVVVFSMMLSTVAFAAFPDVNEDADYANAVNTIAALGIVGGDDQGNFNPDNTITRAEFTKMICEAQAIKGDAAKGATIFTDVAADHWASGYINMAVGQNIINGMGDGTFAPESPVTYEQAIKMIVVALGYEPMAADRGGYPTGYMVVAQSIGVTKGVSAPAQTDAAKRSLIAELIYNALDVPMMEQTGFGSDKTFEIMDGTNNKSRVTLLTSKFDVAKLGGVVKANDKIATDGGSAAPEGEINFWIDNNYKTTNKDYQWSTGNGKMLNGVAVGETNVADLLGKRAIIFVQEDNNEYTVIAAVADETKTSTVTFALTDIDTGARTDISTTDKKTIAYFADDNAKNSTKLDIVNSPDIIWNNSGANVGYQTLSDIIDAANASVAARVTLTDWDADNKYDAIAVESYTHFVVEEVDADQLMLETEAATFDLDDEDEDYTITIKDVDGNDVAFEDIAVGDVIAVISDNISAPWNPAVYMDVVVLGESVVEGTVTAWDPNSTSGKKATIGDATYTVSTEYTAGKIDIASEGAFYLDINGNIFAFDGTKAASGNLGIILKVAVVSSGVDSDVAQVKLLNKDGQVVVYNIAETLKVRKANDSLVSYKRANAVNAATDLASTSFAAANGAADGQTIGVYLEKIFDGTNNAVVDSVVQYKANANGEITELTPAGVTDRFTVDAPVANAEYSSNSRRFAGAGKLEAGALLFSINNTDIEKSKVITEDALIDEAKYTVALIDEDNDYIAAIILSGGNALGSKVSGWAVVTGKATTNDAEGNTAYSLTVVENNKNEEKAILVTEETLLADDYTVKGAYSSSATTLAAGMGVGSILLYTADADGNATVIAPIANVSGNGYVAVDNIDLTGATVYGEDTYKYGITNAKFDGNEIFTTAGTIEVETGSNKYRFNNANPRNLRVEVGAYKGGNVVNSNGVKGNAVLARYVDGEVTDVIAVDTQVDIPAVLASTSTGTHYGKTVAEIGSFVVNQNGKNIYVTGTAKAIDYSAAGYDAAPAYYAILNLDGLGTATVLTEKNGGGFVDKTAFVDNGNMDYLVSLVLGNTTAKIDVDGEIYTINFNGVVAE
ncbi:MAG: S-layer homology domain-containing protein [Clostridia bacterium]|nr:S-layer homology domain-containing protein [Clostridia bacterium]